MDNKLVISDNKDEFMMKLNQATGFNEGMPFFPHLKFDGGEGMWKEETDEKDQDNKPVYKDLAPVIEFQIITTRVMVQSKFETEPRFYSRETQDNHFELLDNDGNVVRSDNYQELKNAFPNIVYIKVLYVYYNGKPYRVKLSGSKLTNLFAYQNQFRNDNPACYLTKAGQGQKLKKGAVSYYELTFAKSKALTDWAMIAERVNGINEYLTIYNQSKAKKNVIPAVEDYSQPIKEDEDEIKIENIPF